MISNPARYQSRYDLYFKFADNLARCGIQLWTVEIAFGNRPHVVTQDCNPFHLQLRTEHELWHKENAINLIVSRLPFGCRYIACVDADIEFQRWDGRKAWWLETMQQLQHYHVVQMFSQAVDMNYDREVIRVHNGFAYSYRNGFPYGKRSGHHNMGQPGYSYWHPGFAWAWRREAWDAVGGLIDTCILGAADWHMAYSLIGKAEDTLNTPYTQPYKDKILAWQARATRYIRKNIGYVPGIINHYFHGAKKNRFYQTRWKILTDNRFNPEIDIARDWQGLWQLVDHGTERSIRLRDDIRAYFRARNEDSIDQD
jgi:hypothetical protein